MVPEEQKTPPGFKLRHSVRVHKDNFIQIEWSPSGNPLATVSKEGTVHLWDPKTAELRRTFEGDPSALYGITWAPEGRSFAMGSKGNAVSIYDSESGALCLRVLAEEREIISMAWSPAGHLLALGSRGGVIELWDAESGRLHHKIKAATSGVYTLAWSPDGSTLASGFYDGEIRLWNVETGKLVRDLKGHRGPIRVLVTSIAWIPSGACFASSASDKTVRIWDAKTGQAINILEGHNEDVTSVSFSFDGLFLATKSLDNSVKLWRCDKWQVVAALPEHTSGYTFAKLAFHPSAPVLATFGEGNRSVRVWDIDPAHLLGVPPVTSSVHYTNAKVVLVGDSGVGKSGLGLVLAGQSFSPTESTHARHVWTFDHQEVAVDSSRAEVREILLWDLAGQPGYRLIHQLHLDEVQVALVVFDARSEADPFSGIRHWDRALRQAQRIRAGDTPLIKKYLVAARIDRGGIPASRERIKFVLESFGFEGYFETSAREGWGISNLVEAIRSSIDWQLLPKVMSTALFQEIKSFLLAERETGVILSTVDDLYRLFLKSAGSAGEPVELRTQFDTCIGLVESRGLIRRLSFGNLVLLQSELLDAYASSIVMASKDEPDGLGSLLEEDVYAGRFPMSSSERIPDREQERLLLIATVEDLLRHEIALREPAGEGPYLVFPSQLTRENPDLPDPEGKAVVFVFEGPVINIYATLAVRISHSGLFRRSDMWRNAASYRAIVGGNCGMFLREMEEGRGELTLFFDSLASNETRVQFEEFVASHLRRRALPESVKRRRIIVCNECGTPLTDLAVSRRRERGFDWISCNVCDTKVLLCDGDDHGLLARDTIVPEMVRFADTQRDLETAESVLQGKLATGTFDVLLCYNPEDLTSIIDIANKLKRQGILPWLDVWELRPGQPWQKVLEKEQSNIRSVAVFVGSSGISPWQNLEIRALLRRFATRRAAVIPVILPKTGKIPPIPAFLESVSWVDLRKRDGDAFQRLVWGITGTRRASE